MDIEDILVNGQVFGGTGGSSKKTLANGPKRNCRVHSKCEPITKNVSQQRRLYGLRTKGLMENQQHKKRAANNICSPLFGIL